MAITVSTNNVSTTRPARSEMTDASGADVEQMLTIGSKHLISIITAAIALWGAALAFAQAYGDGEGMRERAELLNRESTKSRADVEAELRQAQHEGPIAYADRADASFIAAPSKSELSRAQARAHAIEAGRQGLLDGNGDRAAGIEALATAR